MQNSTQISKTNTIIKSVLHNYYHKFPPSSRMIYKIRSVNSWHHHISLSIIISSVNSRHHHTSLIYAISSVNSQHHQRQAAAVHIPEMCPDVQFGHTGPGLADSRRSLAIRGISAGIPSSRSTLRFHIQTVQCRGSLFHHHCQSAMSLCASVCANLTSS